MTPLLRFTILCLTGLSLIGTFAACGDAPEENKTVPQQPVRKEKKKKREAIDIFAEPTRRLPIAAPAFDNTSISTGSAEMKPPAEIKSEILQPISSGEADSRTQIRQSKRSVWQVRTPINAGSLAESIVQNTQLPENTRYLWVPQPVQGSLQLFRVPDVKLSPDASVLVFLETLGEAQGPFGSRLILMSTNSWNVLNILEIRDRYFEKFEFIPGTTKIAALCIAQKACRQEQGFACIDLLTGKEERFQQIDPGIGDVAFLVDNRKNLIVSHPERQAVIVLPLESKGHQEIQVESPNSMVALSNDGTELAVLNPKHGRKIEIFRTSDWLPAATVSLPETINAKRFYFARGKKSFLICGDPSYSSGSLLIRAGKAISPDGIASGRALFTENGKKIYHLTDTGNEIQVIDSITGAEQRIIEVNRAEPHFRKAKPGKVTHLFYIPTCKGLAMFDSNGNLFLIPAERQGTEKGKNDERAIIFQRDLVQ